MQKHAFSNSTLADKLGCSYELVYKVAERKAPATGNFKWRFGEVFGFDVAQALFPPTEAAREIERP
ncbi:MAG TPA: hypothetical protein VNK95_03940 [Caldilineaceae bacterium]|nr:hypothetical protein [Caldilineaceae bacterium]